MYLLLDSIPNSIMTASGVIFQGYESDLLFLQTDNGTVSSALWRAVLVSCPVELATSFCDNLTLQQAFV